MNTEAKVSALYHYPIKSCKGSQLETTQIGERGLPFDRRWMVVDKNGKFISQREYNSLALVLPLLQLDTNTLTVLAPGISSTLNIDLGSEGHNKRVTVWNNECNAIDEGDLAAEWFSDYLHTNCRLVKMDPKFIREREPGYGRFQFADGAPLTIISQASLNDLNERIINKGNQPIPMDRFRPNIVVTDTEPFEEDTWSLIGIGEVKMDVIKPIVRCPIPQINQQTSKKHKEPIKTLFSYRKISPKEVIFGQKAVSLNQGSLSVDNYVTVFQTKPRPQTN